MRKRFLWILLLAIPALAGCTKSGGDALAQALDFRARLLSCGGASFTAEVLADYGEEVYRFTLQCRYDTQGQTQLTVRAPESLEGITASVDGQDGSIVYDGAELSFPALTQADAAPVAAPAIAAEAMHQAYITSAGNDGERLHCSYEQGFGAQKMTTDVWFSDMLPTYAELRCGGSCVLRLTITDFQFL